jgi:hypothetical protein
VRELGDAATLNRGIEESGSLLKNINYLGLVTELELLLFLEAPQHSSMISMSFLGSVSFARYETTVAALFFNVNG